MEVIWSHMRVNCSWMCFGWVVPHIFCSWLVVHLEIPVVLLIEKTEVSHFHRSWPLTLDSVVYYSYCCSVVGVYWRTGGCGWPNSRSISLGILASWALRNNAPNSASAVDAATSLRIAHVMWMLPFNWMFWLSFGVLPRKNILLYGFFLGPQINMMHLSVGVISCLMRRIW